MSSSLNISDNYSYDVSIIIVNYNKVNLTANCVESIIKYTKEIKFEIIVVDNNSTQGDIREALLGYPEVILILNNRNIGFAAGNNLGLEKASGKYYLILNNDTLLLENTIKSVYDFAESNQGKLFVGCELKNKDGSHQESVLQFDNINNYLGEKLFLYKIFPKSKLFNRYYQNYVEVREPIEVDIIKGAFMFCDAKSIIALKGFDERFFFYGEEVDLCFRFKSENGKIIYFPQTKIIHYGGATVADYKWFDFKNQVIARIQILQKHYHGLNFFIMLILHYLGIFLRVWIYLLDGIIKVNKSQIKKSFYYIKQLFIYPQNQF
jgi:hypothetical protein